MDIETAFISWIEENFDPVPEPYEKPGYLFTCINGKYYGPISREGASEFLTLLPPDEAVGFFELLEQGINTGR